MICKLCRRCKKIIVHPATYCSDCYKIVEEEKNEKLKARERKYNSHRNPKYLQFYKSKEWYQLKERKLADEQYRCQFNGCKNLAADVHHIIPIQTSDGWERKLDYDNLEALCVEHHNYRHNRFIKRKEERK